MVACACRPVPRALCACRPWGGALKMGECARRPVAPWGGLSRWRRALVVPSPWILSHTPTSLWGAQGRCPQDGEVPSSPRPLGFYPGHRTPKP